MKKKIKKSDRFNSYEEYLKVAKKTAAKVVYNRKLNAIQKHYSFPVAEFQDFQYPPYETYHNWEERRAWFLNECYCPISLMNEFINAINFRNEDVSKFGIIAQELGKTTLQSFERWGDKNFLEKSIKRKYISKQGLSLDVQAQGMSLQYNKTIEENDLIEFIISYPSGPESYETHQYLIDLNQHFKNLLGFSLDFSFIHSFFKQSQPIASSTDIALEDCPF